MCAESCLVLRLQGPLQSWGTESRFDYRKTGTMPSRSAIAGMLCAALGLDRGGAAEKSFLQAFAAVRMTAFSVQLKGKRDVAEAFFDSVAPAAHSGEEAGASEPLSSDSFSGASALLPGTGSSVPAAAGPRFRMRRMQDYHTAMNAVTADSKERDPVVITVNDNRKGGNTVVTRRQYLNDALFLVFLRGEANLMEKLAGAVQDPVWGIWLGRKACIPSAPVFAGLYPSQEEAEGAALAGLYVIARESDCSDFPERTDSLPDMPLCFASAGRRFALRGVRRTVIAEERRSR